MNNYENSASLKKILLNRKQILIALDARVDMDALASSVGLSYILNELKIPNLIVCASSVQKSYSEIFEICNYLVTDSALDIFKELPEVEMIIIPDIGSLDQLGDLYTKNKAFFQKTPKLLIDHHAENSIPCDVSIIDTDAAATCEQVYLLSQDFGISFPKKINTLLLTGIFSDTRSFSTPNVTSRTFKITHELVENKADVVTASRLVRTHSVSQLKLWGSSLNELEVVCDGKIGIVAITKVHLAKSGSKLEDSIGLISIVDDTSDFLASALIKETSDGNYGVSLRSPGIIPVVEIAKKYSGGGHKYAAGCKFTTKDLASVKEILVQEFDQLIRNHLTSY